MSTFSPEVVTFLSSPFLPYALLSSTAGRQKEVRATEVLFLVIYSWIFHLIFMPFSGLSVCSWEFAALKAAEAKNHVLAPMSPADEGKRERDREGMREWVFMCSLVNERQALKVTGCVYYWSVSRLMGRREGRRERRAVLMSKDQSTQAWESERAPSNKLHSRSACPCSLSDSMLH